MKKLCYNKIIETSDKYLIGYLPTFEDLFEITCTAFIAKGISLMILGNTIESIKEARQFGEYLDVWPDRRYLWNYKRLEDYENFWLYRAKICVRRGYNVDWCFKDLEKNLENIMNDERFLKRLSSTLKHQETLET
jgi:hypothetical protein